MGKNTSFSLDEHCSATRERWAADQAEKYLRVLQHAIERAVGDPRIGRACDEVSAGYRRLAAGSHQVYHRVTDDCIVDVVRILHQRMDVDRHL